MLVNDPEGFLEKLKIGTAFGLQKVSLYRDHPVKVI
jgi:hypothetical protein